MKVAIMIMAVNSQPSLRNVETFKETLIKTQQNISLKNDYDYFIYWSEKEPENKDRVKHFKDESYNNVYNVIVNEDEGVYRTFEKTWYAFDYINNTFGEYDRYVRINISMFLNIRLLDEVVGLFKNEAIYCNAINSHVNLNSVYCNDIYARGDLMIFGKPTLDGIIKNGKKYLYSDVNVTKRDGVDHVDDCIMGLCVMDTYGDDYYTHLYMMFYNYLPEDYDNVKGYVNLMAIGSRVKSVPPNVNYSGYSWDDNEWRLLDCKKMKLINEYYNELNHEYTNLKLPNILVEKKASRPIILVQGSNQNLYDVFYQVLKNKKKLKDQN